SESAMNRIARTAKACVSRARICLVPLSRFTRNIDKSEHMMNNASVTWTILHRRHVLVIVEMGWYDETAIDIFTVGRNFIVRTNIDHKVGRTELPIFREFGCRR